MMRICLLLSGGYDISDKTVTEAGDSCDIALKTLRRCDRRCGTYGVVRYISVN
jgi:hypothetical protein